HYHNTQHRPPRPSSVLSDSRPRAPSSFPTRRSSDLAGVKLGRRVVVHPGAVIGADGFGYAFDGEAHRKIPQVGGVLIEDDVEIGDRKSTRLNSSHLGISYAVFCLKKKRKRQDKNTSK